MNTNTVACSKCFQMKELAKGKTFCKDCKQAYERKRRAAQNDSKKEELKSNERGRYHSSKEDNLQKTVINMQNDLFMSTPKKCSVCGTIKEVREFHVHKGKGTVRAACKECASRKRREYYKDNQVAVCQQATRYQLKKMKVDPAFKLTVRLRTRISSALHAQGKKKVKRTLKYIGCSADFLQEWMSFQLYDGMTLENYGTLWHVDHVTPCASFDLSVEDQVIKCFSWRNLRPLVKGKNLEKRDKIIEWDIVLQELKAKCFMRTMQQRAEKLPV